MYRTMVTGTSCIIRNSVYANYAVPVQQGPVSQTTVRDLFLLHHRDASGRPRLLLRGDALCV